MESRAEHIERLKQAVVAAFGQTLDAPTDYERLSADIQRKTGEVISTSTLKRLFGYIRPGTIPRPSTLSVLARYVGSTGWSDFCSRWSDGESFEPSKSPESSGQPVSPEPPRGVPAKTAGRHSVVYRVVTLLCAVGVVGWLVWGAVRRNGEGPFMNRSGESLAAASDREETDEQKYERLMRTFVALTQAKCDSVRACRPHMDLISYKELVDSVYFPFVFTFLQDSIKRQAARTFADDEQLRVRYTSEIWERCRDICADLMREIPSDELIRAYDEASASRSAR